MGEFEQEMMKFDLCIEIPTKNVSKHAENIFTGGDTFRLDLVFCHCSKKVKKFFSRNNISVLEWPGSSPDINPIGNLWTVIKRPFHEQDCTITTKLIKAIISMWYRDEKIVKICKKLVKSKPKIFSEVIKNSAGHINY